MNYRKGSSYDNRGMNLEYDLNITNDYYLQNSIACINKKPTPIQVVKVLKTVSGTTIIKEAFFKTPSTTDYNGIYNGLHIDFEAKETNLDYFPISNIHNHQIKHLETIMNMKGFSFVIIRFNKYDHTFLLETKYILEFIKINNKKSIPYKFFCNNGHLIDLKYNPRLDYISVINLILEGEKI